MGEARSEEGEARGQAEADQEAEVQAQGQVGAARVPGARGVLWRAAPPAFAHVQKHVSAGLLTVACHTLLCARHRTCLVPRAVCQSVSCAAVARSRGGSVRPIPLVYKSSA